MIYAVIDTNVFVAALLTKHSDSATIKVFEAIADGDITNTWTYCKIWHRGIPKTNRRNTY